MTRVSKGPTIKQMLDSISYLRPEDKASPREREKARESLRKRCPYLFVKRGKTK
jgi:hypothetical protein